MKPQITLGTAAWMALAILAATPGLAALPRAINNNDTVVLHRNVHRLARPEYDVGAAPLSLPMEQMILTLRLAPEKQAELDQLLAEQQNPASPNHQSWLTPEQFGERFGCSAQDLEVVTDWLRSQGFLIEEVAKGRTWVTFTGMVADTERAFHTRIDEYVVNRTRYHANAWDPAIPRALAPVVAGVVSLHNFPRVALNTGILPLSPTPVAPQYTAGGGHYLSPGDFATIYNVSPLYSAGVTGAGVTIAIVGRTHPSTSNWSTFRSLMALPANPPTVVVNGPDPGDLGANEDAEADLDVEWAGAVAPAASIVFVTSRSTSSTDGVDLSAQYIVNQNLGAAMSTSFGSGESQMGSAENTFYNNLWAQAAAQGITAFVASGDSGAAGNDSGNSRLGSGLAVSGLASTPYNVCVGGTQFNEGSGSYWSAGNGAGGVSALGYIPEVAWNESGTVAGGSGLWASGGGVSSLYAKPAWQVCLGVPSDGMRDLPDVSLSAAGHDAYLVETQGALYAIGGTSASSPSFAGLMALIVQSTGLRQGNANARFYQLGSLQYSGGAAVFHDSTSGNNTVPGVTGYSCNVGYDLVTGLGSVDATELVTNWGGVVTPTPDFSLAVWPMSFTAAPGGAATAVVTTTLAGGFSADVALSTIGLPAGVTASLTPATIPAPGAGSATLTLTVGTSTATGIYNVTVSGTGGGATHPVTVTLTISAPVTTLLSDGFEGSGWAAAQVSGSAGRWTLTRWPSYPRASPHGGAMLADFNSYTSPRGSQTRLYRTAAFTVPATAASVTLRFWMYHDRGYAYAADKVQAQVSTNRTTWTNVGSAVARYNGSTGWAQVTLDLSPYKGNTVYLGFVGISAFGNDEYLDDVSVVAQ